jgi:uncharacterized Fe-S cluster protein YjdI
MSEPRKRYTGQAVDVSFDPARCRHAAECLRGLPAVFDRHRRPWVLPDGGAPADVVDVLARCPTGALRTHPRESVPREQPATPAEIGAVRGGPVLVRGDLHVTAPSGLDERETRAALCSCGTTANVPYCDGSGTCRGWPA